MKDWYLEWYMDGMQWEVLQVDLYEFKQDTHGYEGIYHECFKFMYTHLLPNNYAHAVPDIFMHCLEGTFKLSKQDVIAVLTNYCPEELI